MRRSLFCFLLALGAVLWVSAATALPIWVAQQQMPSTDSSIQQNPTQLSTDLEQLFNYLHEQKYTLWLGDNRGACGYYIDPTDVYQQGDSRFTMAKMMQGMRGTVCRGILEFRVLQADCKTNTLYQFVRETEGEPRQRRWQHLQMSLADLIQNPIPEITGHQEVAGRAAKQICMLSAKSASMTNLSSVMQGF